MKFGALLVVAVGLILQSSAALSAQSDQSWMTFNKDYDGRAIHR